MQSQAASHLTSLITLLLISFFLAACQQESPSHSNDTHSPNPIAPSQLAQSNADWHALIQSHNKGFIGRDDNIKIRFNRDIIDKQHIGESADKQLQINTVKGIPVVGKTVFESTNEIVFIPQSPLISGTTFKASLKAQGLLNVSNDWHDYHFSVQTIPLDFELKTDSLQNDPQTPQTMILQGDLLLSDSINGELLNKVLTVESQGKSLPLTWTQADDAQHFRFKVIGIPRESYASEIKLSWDMQAIGIDQQGNKSISVPQQGKLSIQEVTVDESDGASHAKIAFSDVLDSTQMLQGLVSILDKHDDPLKPDDYKLQIRGQDLLVFPKKSLVGKHKLKLFPGIRSVSGKKIIQTSEHAIYFEKIKPQVRFVGKGHILPKGEQLQIPFEAASVNAVQVTAFEIFPHNIQQFLQNNSLDGEDNTHRVGRYLWRKTLPIKPADPNRWNRYSLDVSELMEKHPDSLFQLTLSVDRRHADYGCEADPSLAERTDAPLQNHEDDNTTENSGWDGIESYFDEDDYEHYRYEDRDNPCKDSYYLSSDSTSDYRNFIASNIGLIVKRDLQGQTHIIANDLQTSAPMSGVKLTIQNFQAQPLATAETDENGFATINLPTTPFLLMAEKDGDTAYLKLNAATALATSHFDIGGETIKKGIKGTIYGERGVWRPGDDIHLTFVVLDKHQQLPQNHPVTMKLFDAQGREVDSQVNHQPVGDFYTFTFKTDDKAGTGKWLAKAHLGGQSFSKTLSVETVRPNRLKVELEFPGNRIDAYREEPQGVLFSQWLHGGSAAGLKTDISVRLREKSTQFTRFSDYAFDDPARRLDSEDQKIVEGYLDDDGYLSFRKGFAPQQKAPGMLSAWFTSRVFEKSGAFSTSRQFVDYYPYANYVGIQTPKGDAARNMLLTDTKHTVDIASLDANGEPVSLDQVQVTLYKIDWKWWWDKTTDNLSKYANANHSSKIQQSIVQTINGKAQWAFEIKYPEWGRYLVRACDLQGLHCTGKTLYVDWPGWAGRAQEQGGGAASQLSLYSDKQEYRVGETAIVQLPKATQGRALLTIETGSDILRQEWLELTGERSQIELPITAEMAPNAYFSLSVLQAHQGKQNDRPIRLYGITPIQVHDPNTHLHPQLVVADEWKPQSQQTIQVSEANGKAMTYTLAIVDEGLLGLTRFKTPNLHRVFYQREKLGIKTWDLYDDVVGAYGGKLERLLALGGGDDVQLDDDANRQRRFPPVVQFLGAFQLAAGESKTHDIQLPAYLGAVRVMLVAGNVDPSLTLAAYGQADKSVFVRQPLMLQASLPRVLRADDEVNVPITLFVGEENIKQVQLDIELGDHFELVDQPASQTINIDKIGEQLAWVRIKAKQTTGKGHLRFKASSGEHESNSESYLDVRSPNPVTANITQHKIEAGETWQTKVQPFGLAGTQRASLEVSNVPDLKLGQHLNYLLNYPHGCLEQTTATAFPQLYLPQLTRLSETQQTRSEDHVKKAIDDMRQFQLSSGDFSYWPNTQQNSSIHNEWASLFAGHFLIEAEKQGYLVPQGMLSQWLKWQRTKAQNWLSSTVEYSKTQAYRLYILSLAGKPVMGAMNRLRESGSLSQSARWLLASAYQQSGQNDAANSLLEGLLPEIKDGLTDSDRFESELAAQGQLLANLVALGKTQDADLLISQISNTLDQPNHNTHGIAWTLMAMSRHFLSNQQSWEVDYTWQGNNKTLNAQTPIVMSELGSLNQAQPLSITNKSDKARYVNLIRYGVPAQGEEQAMANGLGLSVAYLTTDKQASTLSNSEFVQQGTDIVMQVTLSNKLPQKQDNIALALPMASGWEIHNATYEFKTDQESNTAGSNKSDYTDVRDDELLIYVSLEANESRTFNILLNASYQGSYYQPAIIAEAMYDPTIKAIATGKWIKMLEKNSPLLNPDTIVANTTDDVEMAEVGVAKAWLYGERDEASQTRMYLIQGDKVEVLEYHPDWVFIRYKALEKWVKESDLIMG